MSIKAEIAPMHPGEVLDELYLKPLGMSAGALAKALHVPRTRIERIVKGSTGISAETAVRLGRYFRTTPDVWLAMQAAWDVGRTHATVGADIEAIEPFERDEL